MEKRALVRREAANASSLCFGDHPIDLLDVHRVQSRARNCFPPRDLLRFSSQPDAGALAEGGLVQLPLVRAARRPKLDPPQIEERAGVTAEVSEVRDTATKAS